MREVGGRSKEEGRAQVLEHEPSQDLCGTVGLDGSNYADTFSALAPDDIGDDVQRAARRFLASVPTGARRLLAGRDRVALLLDREAERHASRVSDEALPVVVGERLSMFRVYRVDQDEIVLGEEDRLMRYRILLRLDPESRRFTCATVVRYGRGPLGRVYFVAGLPVHRWFVRSTLRRFAAS